MTMPLRSPRHLVVTGGTGYIGTRVVERALAEGRRVTVLGRRPGLPGTRHVCWTLGDPLPCEALGPADTPGDRALVHLAHDWQAGEALNVAGTETLFASALDAGIGARIFISSQSARHDALNAYGRMKWAIERRIGDATSLRVGLVYGGPRVAMYGLLCRLARLPVLPMIEPNRTVQPIHVDEVVRGILAAADGCANGVLALAGPEQVRFGDVLRMVAQTYAGRRLRILPVPLRLALVVCDVSAFVPLLPTVDRERVMGLAGTEPIASAVDLARLGLVVQPMATHLPHEPAGRRARLAEGHAFLSHAGIRPTSALLRRYAKALPEGAISRPHGALRWREPLGSGGELARRLRLAARIAEASLAGETMLAAGSQAGRLVRLATQAMLELAMLPSRLLAGALRQ